MKESQLALQSQSFCREHLKVVSTLSYRLLPLPLPQFSSEACQILPDIQNLHTLELLKFSSVLVFKIVICEVSLSWHIFGSNA